MWCEMESFVVWRDMVPFLVWCVLAFVVSSLLVCGGVYGLVCSVV